MATERSIYIRTRVRDTEKAIAELRKLGADGDAAIKRIQKSAKGASTGLKSIDKASKEAQRGLSGLAARAGPVGTVLASLGPAGLAAGVAIAAVGLLTVKLIKNAETLKLVEARLKLAISGYNDFGASLDRVRQLAIETRGGFETTATLFSRLSRSAKALAVSQGDVLTVTRAVNQSVRVSGATAQEASAGILQFGQAIASNRLAGDELRSVLEQLPFLAQQIAAGMGVTIGSLREMAEAGELTGRRVIEAIVSQSGEIDTAFQTLPATIESMATRVSDAFARISKAADDHLGLTGLAVGVFRGFAIVLEGLAESIEPAGDLTQKQRERVESELKDLRDSLANIGSEEISFPALLTLTARVDSLESSLGGLAATAAVTFGDIEAAYAKAIADADAAKVQERARIQGLTDGIDALAEALNPSIKKLRELGEQEKQVADALDQGAITAGRAAEVMALIAAERADVLGITKKLADQEKEFQKALEATLKAGEKIDKRRADARKKIDALVVGLRQERADLKLTARELAIAVELRKAETIALKAGIDLGPERTAQLREEAAALFDANAEIERRKEVEEAATKAAEDAADERRRIAEAEAEAFQRPFLNAIDGIQGAFTDAFEDALSGGINSAEDAAAAIKRIFIRAAAETATLQFIRPALGLSGGGIGSTGGGLSLGGGAGVGGSGGSFDFSSISSALNFGNLSVPGLGSIFTSGGAPFSSTVAGPSIGSSGLLPVSGAQFGVGAALGGIGANLAGFTTGNQFGDMAASTIGAIAGSFIPIPILGTAIGAFAGQALGSLISDIVGGGTSVGPNSSVNVDIPAAARRASGLDLGSTGTFTAGALRARITGGGQDNGGSIGESSPLGQTFADAINALNAFLGPRLGAFLDPSGASLGNIGGRQFSSFGGASVELVSTGDAQTVIDQLIKETISRAFGNGTRLIGGDGQAANLGGTAFSEFGKTTFATVDEQIAALETLVNEYDRVTTFFAASADDLLTVQKSIETEARNFVAGVQSQVSTLREDGLKFGIAAATIEEKLQGAVLALIGEQGGTAEELSAVEIQLRRIRATFAEMGTVLEDVGLSSELAAEKLAEAETRIREDFSGSIQNQILALTDPARLALEQLEAAQEERLRSAEALGVDLVEIERLNALERAAVLEQFGASALRAFTDSLLLSDLSPLSPGARLDSARSNFDTARLAALGGDSGAIGSFPDIVQAFLRESRDFNASSATFADDFASANRALDQVLALQESTAGGFEDLALSFQTATADQTEALATRLDQVIDALSDLRLDIRANQAA